MNSRFSKGLTAADIVKGLRVYKLIVILFFILGLGLGGLKAGLAYLAARNVVVYTVSASVAVVTKESGGTTLISPDGTQYVEQASTDVYLAQKLADSVSYIAKSKRVLDEVVVRTGSKYTTDSIQSNISVTPYNSTQILTVTLKWHKSDEGKKILASLVDVLPNVLLETLQLGDVNVIDWPAVVSNAPISFNYFNVFLYAFLGLFLGCLLAIFISVIRPTYRTPKDIKDILTLDTVGEIPAYVPGKDKNSKKKLAYQESINALVSIMMFVLDRNRAKCFYLTSTAQGEGKSTLSSKIASVMARMNKKVLLIDFDTRQHIIRKLFSLDKNEERCIESVISGDMKLIDAIIHFDENLDLIQSVSKSRASKDFTRLAEQINEIKAAYDYIICDTAPVGVVADALMLNAFCDGAFFVIKQDFIRMDIVSNAVALLSKSGATIFGCILNAVKEKDAYYNYYYKKKYTDSYSRDSEVIIEPGHKQDSEKVLEEATK